MSIHFTTIFKCDQSDCHEEWSGFVQLGIDPWNSTFIKAEGPKKWTMYTVSSPFKAFGMEKEV